MKILDKQAEGLSRHYTVLAEPSDVERFAARKLQDIAKKVKMDGFRPGKVPVEVVQRMYGSAVLEDAKNDAVAEAAKEAASTENIGGMNDFNTNIVKDSEEGIEFTMDFEVLPEFELLSTDGIELIKHVAQITDFERNRVLEGLRGNFKNWVEVAADTPVAEGHKVVVDMDMTTKIKKYDSKPMLDLEVVIGDKSMVDDFWKHFIGAKAGDTVEFDIQYPENFGQKRLAGKKVHYTATIKKVLEAKEFQIDEEFAKFLGYDNLESALKWAESLAKSRYDRMSDGILHRDFLEKISDMYSFDVPKTMCKIEKQEIENYMKGEIGKFEKEYNEEIDKECDKIAADRVRLGFIIAQIAKRDNIVVSRNELSRAIREIAMAHPGQEREIYKLYNERPELVSTVIGPILEDKVVKALLSKLEPKEEACTVYELEAIDEEPFDFLVEDVEAYKKELAEKKKAEAEEKMAGVVVILPEKSEAPAETKETSAESSEAQS